MEFAELQDSLQAACEDSISAVLSALQLKLPMHPILAPLSRQLAQVCMLG